MLYNVILLCVCMLIYRLNVSCFEHVLVFHVICFAYDIIISMLYIYNMII